LNNVATLPSQNKGGVSLGFTMLNTSSITTPSLIMLYQSIRIALEQDDQMPERRQFEIRENPEWRRWSEHLAGELSSRGVQVDSISWEDPHEIHASDAA
jgi:hypothetical protein